MTRAEVPSGNTSQSFTDSEAAGASALTRSRTRGWPISVSPPGSHSHTSECASSSRWSTDNPQGRCPAQSIQAAVPTSGCTASDRGPGSSRVSRVVAADGHASLTQRPS